jgi:protein-S-isoprenylcysteine O-methyltransferase Ste14
VNRALLDSWEHVALLTAITVFIIAWAVWLWAMICLPQWWATVVDKEHAILVKRGLLPARWAPRIRNLETGWVLKAIVALTIVVALLVQRLA